MGFDEQQPVTSITGVLWVGESLMTGKNWPWLNTSGAMNGGTARSAPVLLVHDSDVAELAKVLTG